MLINKILLFNILLKSKYESVFCHSERSEESHVLNNEEIPHFVRNDNKSLFWVLTILNFKNQHILIERFKPLEDKLGDFILFYYWFCHWRNWNMHWRTSLSAFKKPQQHCSSRHVKLCCRDHAFYYFI